MKNLETLTSEYNTVCKLLEEKIKQRNASNPLASPYLIEEIIDLKLDQAYLADKINQFPTEEFLK